MVVQVLEQHLMDLLLVDHNLLQVVDWVEVELLVKVMMVEMVVLEVKVMRGQVVAAQVKKGLIITMVDTVDVVNILVIYLEQM